MFVCLYVATIIYLFSVLLDYSKLPNAKMRTMRDITEDKMTVLDDIYEIALFMTLSY